MEDDQTPLYTYKPLHSKFSTRLIDLHPAPEACSDLRCDIIEVSLLGEASSHPPYAALSYAWGCSDKIRRIICGSTRLPITASLDTALRAVRRTTWNLLLWVDAVCIDQEDVTERNQQVASMMYIYSRASSVLIWLGTDDEVQSGAKCLVCLRQLGRTNHRTPQSNINYGEELPFSVFFARQWFTRRWVVQEAAVAPHAFVLCGTERISWDDFMRGVERLRTHLELMGNLSCQEAFGKLYMIQRLNQYHRAATVKSALPRSTMLQLLLQFEASLCIDGRDRIYSLIRLAEVVTENLEPLTLSLDYSLSTETVYEKVAQVLLTSTDDYAVLHYSAAFRSEHLTPSQMPSWVPDWRHRCRFTPLQHPDYKCGFGRPGNIYINLDGSLTARGHIHDHVVSGLHSVPQSTKRTRNISEIAEALGIQNSLKRIDIFGPVDGTSGCLNHHPPARGTSFFVKSIEAQLLSETQEQKVLPLIIQDNDITSMSSSQQEAEATPAVADPCKQTSSPKDFLGRRLFSTRKETFGLGPLDAQDGDVVVVIYGMRTPFLLREDTARSGWYIIGDAYIPGMTKKPTKTRETLIRNFRII